MISFKKAVAGYKKEGNRHKWAARCGMKPSTFWYHATGKRAGGTGPGKRSAKKKSKKTASKKSAPVVLTATIRAVRAEFQKQASALASLIAAQTA